MSKRAVVSLTPAVFLTILALVVLFVNFDRPPAQVVSQPVKTEPVNQSLNPAAETEIDYPTPEKLLVAVNQERAKASVPPLSLSPLLNQSTQFKAQDMLDRNYFDHADPKTGKNNGLDYALQIGVNCRASIAENITDNIHVNDVRSAMNAWVNSPKHYKAMIDPKYQSTGFGIAGTKIVEHFCDNM